jgi:DNA-binding NarL/FixJ family response regulator
VTRASNVTGATAAPSTSDRDARIRVLLVDDQPLLRAGFRMILTAEPDLDVVGDVSNGAEAVGAVATLRPDVVLMDIRMPVMDGVEATRRIVLGRPANADTGVSPPRVLILTTFDLDEYVVEALRAGASGFLLKDVPPDDLVAAIRVVAAGDAMLAPTVTRRLLDRYAATLAPVRDGSERDGPPAAAADLTERELEVWRLMARGLSNQEIADTLFLGETTVKTHVSRVLMKLDVRDRVQAVVLAYELGIVRPGDTGPTTPPTPPTV